MGSYKVTIGDKTVRRKTLREAKAVVMEAVTDFLGSDPEGASQGALMANRAFSRGGGGANRRSSGELADNHHRPWSADATAHRQETLVLDRALEEAVGPRPPTMGCLRRGRGEA